MTVSTHNAGPDEHRGRRRAAELSVVAAVAAAGWFLPSVLNSANVEPDAGRPAQSAAVTPVSIERVGEVIATTADSITTMDAAGQVTTFQLTPSTARIAEPAGFAVSDVIVVQATVRNGTAVATTVADRDLVGPDGPPMDYNLPA